MNAGAYGKEIREVVKEVTCIDENLQVYTLQNENMNFSYNESRDYILPLIRRTTLK